MTNDTDKARAAGGKVDMAFKYRLYPTDDQKRQMEVTFGCCRYVYNHFLREREAAWERTQEVLSRPKAVPGTEDGERPEWERDTETGKVVYETYENPAYDPGAKSMSFYDTSKALTRLKRETVGEDGRKWLYDADAVALVYALRNLDRAYQSFFRDVKKLKSGGKPAGTGKPRPKNRSSKRSYKTAGKAVSVDAEGNRIRLPKLGWVRCRVHRPPSGRIVSVTVSRTGSGRWYASVQCEGADAPAQTPATAPAAGIEVGVEHAAVSSDGQVWDLATREKLERRLRHEQRMLAKCEGYRKGERKSNRFKARKARIARLEERIADARRHELNAISHDIAESYGTVCLRKTDWKGLLEKKSEGREVPRFVEQGQNRRLADASPYELQREVAYKVRWRGGDAVVVDSNPASTQTCSACGARNAALAGQKGLSIRSWTCPECGAVHQRDVNSARNLLLEGLQADGEDER